MRNMIFSGYKTGLHRDWVSHEERLLVEVQLSMSLLGLGRCVAGALFKPNSVDTVFFLELCFHKVKLTEAKLRV